MIQPPPGAAHGLIERDTLFERLSAAEAGGVVLVCAPAGSGKTVLLRSWIEASGLEDQMGWVSVERTERDAQRFWLSVIDALADAVGVVQRVAPAPMFNGRAVVEQVLADLESLEEPGMLVIDDLHELASADALEWLEVFLSSLALGAARGFERRAKDPRLGFHRLRLSGQLTELRAGDLRFSMDETEELLRAEGIALSPGAVARLYERTEGWVRWPISHRRRRRRTHAARARGCQRVLTSLDARRFWFRYHHLFADRSRWSSVEPRPRAGIAASSSGEVARGAGFRHRGDPPCAGGA